VILSYRIVPVDKFNQISPSFWKDPGSLFSLENDWKKIDIISQRIQSAPEDMKLLEVRCELYNRINLPLYGYADAERIKNVQIKKNDGCSFLQVFLLLDSLIELGNYYEALQNIYYVAKLNSMINYLTNSLQFLSEEESIISRKGVAGYLVDCKQLLKDLDTMMHPNVDINKVFCGYLTLALQKYIEVMQKIEANKDMKFQRINKLDQKIIIDDRESLVMQRKGYIQSPIKTSIREGPNSERSYRNIINFFNSSSKGNDDVVIQPDRHGGFQLIAGKDFFQGDIVLEEEPFVSFSNDIEGSRCAHCHRDLKSRYQTAIYCKCRAGYCSKTCKDAADYQYHKELCGTNYRDLEKNLISTSKTTSGITACLHFRLIARAISDKKRHSEAFSHPTSPLDLPEVKLLHRTIDRPEGSTELMTEEVPAHYYIVNQHSLNSVFGDLSPDCLHSVDMDNFVPTINALMTNSFTMPIRSNDDYDSNDICLALALKGSFFNHDCDPNILWQAADVSNTGRNIIFKAKKTIFKGEPMTISYLSKPLAIPIDIKQQYLKGLYGFECRCSTCIAQLADLERTVAQKME